MLKCLLFSVQSLCDKNLSFYNPLENILLDLSKKYEIFIYSGDQNKSNLLPETLKKKFLLVNRSQVKNGTLISNFYSKGYESSNFIIIGSTENDFLLSTQSKVLLLSAFWSKMDEKVEKYGLRIKNEQVLKYFFEKIIIIKTPWYYKVDVTNDTVIYSLMSSNTHGVSDTEIKKLKNNFQQLLKKNDPSFLQLITYFFICTLNLIKDIHDVNFWTHYPSSDSSDNEILFNFVEKARYSFGNSRNKHPLFIRHKESKKRHFLTSEDRINQGCDEQLDTIHLNPLYEKYIKNKTICVIDDYTTYGTSCETARNLLILAGAKKVIFITFGKFGSSNTYHKYDYTLNGNIFDIGYTHKKFNHSIIKGTTIDNFDEIKESLGIMIWLN